MGNDNVGALQRLQERDVSVVSVSTSSSASSQPSGGGGGGYSAYGMNGSGGSSGLNSELHSSGTSSNTLLVSASPRYFDTVIEMIEQLDEPPPQVQVDALLAEVTLDNTTDLGIDWGYQTTYHGNTIFTGTEQPALPANGDTPATPRTPGLITGPSGGFNFSITGGNLDFFLRALQTQGKMRVLNRPQIVAIDNVASKIVSGQQVPVPTYSYNYGVSSGGIQTSYQYQPVGIILEIVPRIGPDGFVRMDVHTEISSLSDSDVNLGNGVTAKRINDESAETTVTVKDGHSIVIGGLISTSDQTSETKVPLLGDIPLLGWLFKTASVDKTRTELLIVLTPRIIRNVPQADFMTEQEARRLRLMGNNGLKGMTETLYNPINKGPAIWPDGVHWPSNGSSKSSPPSDANGVWPPDNKKTQSKELYPQETEPKEMVSPAVQPIRDLKW